jgi:hypothetical protein
LLGLERFHRVLQLLLGPPAQDFRVDRLDGEIVTKDRVGPFIDGPEEAVAEEGEGLDGFDVRDRN